jgi:hypothetical protein
MGTNGRCGPADRVRTVAAPSSQLAPEDSNNVTVERAVAAFMADSRDRGNSDATLQKKATVFERRTARDPKNRERLIPSQATSLLRHCDQKGIRFLSELDLNTVRDWRSEWKVNSLVRQKRQGQVIGFFWFCERAGWLPRNYASDITRGLGRIQVKVTQTGYFQPDEYKAVIDATYLYSDRPKIDKHNSLLIGGDRIRALTELMRWTGLRIRDAVTLERNRLSHDPCDGIWSVMVYQKKTGDPVYCPIPPDVAEALRTIPASQKGNTNDSISSGPAPDFPRRSFPTGNGATGNCSGLQRSKNQAASRSVATRTCCAIHSPSNPFWLVCASKRYRQSWAIRLSASRRNITCRGFVRARRA